MASVLPVRLVSPAAVAATHLHSYLVPLSFREIYSTQPRHRSLDHVHRNFTHLTDCSDCLKENAWTRTRHLSLERQNRNFFNLPNLGSRNKNYSGRKLIGYPMEQMFNVVSDVENYNKFVPFCNKSLILSKGPSSLKADMIIGFPPVNERYTSHVTMIRPYTVRAECVEGRLFNYLLTVWRFSPGLQSNPNSCVVDFQVAFEFKSAFHSQLTNIFFDKVVLQMENAFVKEVTRRYGKASIPTQVIKTNIANA